MVCPTRQLSSCDEALYLFAFRTSSYRPKAMFSNAKEYRVLDVTSRKWRSCLSIMTDIVIVYQVASIQCGLIQRLQQGLDG